MRKRGFTLVELILYMALMSSVIVVLTEVFLSVISLQAESTRTTSIDTDSRFVLARLFYDINRADNITSPSSLGSSLNSTQLLINGVTYTYGTDVNGAFTISGNSEINTLTSPDSRVTDLTFTRLGNAGGKNSLLVKFKIKAGTETRSYQTTVALR